jgi:CTP:phosphocholine cytidylyltransferase-like protein
MTKPPSSYVHVLKQEGGGKDSKLSIIILASNPGYRMKSFGPKCLIKDKQGVSILSRQMASFQDEFSHYEVIVVGGFEIDKLTKNRPAGIRIVENISYESSNEIEDIRLAINNAMYDNLLIIAGDIYFNRNVINNITQKSTLIVDDNDRMLDDDIGTTIVDNSITIMSMSIKSPKWARIGYFTEKEARLLRQFASTRDNARLFLFEGINYILDKGGEFIGKKTQKNDVLVHVDNSKELEKI